ncbi:MAG: UDP-N-acetylglucosamine 1-carboxyvinyltransferase [Chthonomonas sp.]|nr:UDP-N-acetylglucosamine 1-carboxyvinyltransferase [Chthonomonas sp.]
MDGLSMHVLKIQGGAPLVGDVIVPGSKNAALAILSAVMLGRGVTTLTNVPNVSDIHIKLELLSRFGAKFEWRGDNLDIDCTTLQPAIVEEDIVRPIRTSFYIIGSLLARLGQVTLPAPGGCKIGARPVDFHLKGLAMMGAKIDLDGGNYIAEVDRLRGTEIYLDFPSAGATQHLMSTATLAEGVTVIQNAACEPEIVQLAEFLTAMGARIEGAGTPTVSIIGVDRLHGCTFRVPEDRLQAGTFLLAGAITRGKVTARGIMPDHQIALINKLREAGAECEEGFDWVSVAAPSRLEGIKIKTMPYPGFATDIQQPMAAVLALAKGQSSIEETIYESRTGHVSELNRMGAKMSVVGRLTQIEGVESLDGAVVESSDLRAGAALVLAGLAAEGETIVRNIHFIDRGYMNFEALLNSLGGNVERVATAEAGV